MGISEGSWDSAQAAKVAPPQPLRGALSQRLQYSNSSIPGVLVRVGTMLLYCRNDMSDVGRGSPQTRGRLGERASERPASHPAGAATI
jgi:hypothetical protein